MQKYIICHIFTCIYMYFMYLCHYTFDYKILIDPKIIGKDRIIIMNKREKSREKLKKELRKKKKEKKWKILKH